MRVLHVNNVDLYGRRFNGYDLIEELEPYGIACSQAVLTKLGRNPRVLSLMPERADERLQGALTRVEKRRSMNNLLYPWGRTLAATQQFQDADVVHYHLIHNQMVSLLDLPWLFKLKPAVWTFHDPWPLTGHCIYPMDCTKWMEGCEGCPRLDTTFPMREDHADRMWRVKQRVYRDSNVDIVVASQFMLDLISQSPLTRHFDRTHLVPFGIRHEVYLDDDARQDSRRRLGIPDDDFVVFFRSTKSEFKGLSYIIEALAESKPARKTTLLTVDQKGLLRSLKPEYNIVEFGWVEDQSLYLQLYSACDVFLMPSTAEAFGLMALEAMAAGRPVVCFQGTSLPSITHAPDCGIAVPRDDSLALRRALDHLAANPDEAKRRGKAGRHLAKTEYDHARYLDSLARLYRQVSGRTTVNQLRQPHDERHRVT